MTIYDHPPDKGLKFQITLKKKQPYDFNELRLKWEEIFSATMCQEFKSLSIAVAELQGKMWGGGSAHFDDFAHIGAQRLHLPMVIAKINIVFFNIFAWKSGCW